MPSTNRKETSTKSQVKLQRIKGSSAGLTVSKQKQTPVEKRKSLPELKNDIRCAENLKKQSAGQATATIASVRYSGPQRRSQPDLIKYGRESEHTSLQGRSTPLGKDKQRSVKSRPSSETKDSKTVDQKTGKCKPPSVVRKSSNGNEKEKSSSSSSSISKATISSNSPTVPLSETTQTKAKKKKKPNIIAAIKPDNVDTEFERFMSSSFTYNPQFVYRNLPDAEVMEKRGPASDALIKHALLILTKTIKKYGSYENYDKITGGEYLEREEVVGFVENYLNRMGISDEIRVHYVEDGICAGSFRYVKGVPTLNVRVSNLRKNKAEGLMTHEIGTHYFRSRNNRCQMWCKSKSRDHFGLRPANPTEEGLASLHTVLLRKEPRLWRAALLYYTVYKASVLSFKDLFKDIGQFVTDPYVRWEYCLRAKRGQTDTSLPGGFCKDQVYLQGALQILKNRKTLDFHKLVQMGKISWEDIDEYDQYSNFEETIVPFFMQDLELYHSYLDRICEVNGLTAKMLADV